MELIGDNTEYSSNKLALEDLLVRFTSRLVREPTLILDVDKRQVLDVAELDVSVLSDHDLAYVVLVVLNGVYTDVVQLLE